MDRKEVRKLFNEAIRADQKRSEWNALLGDGQGNLFVYDGAGNEQYGLAWARITFDDTRGFVVRVVRCDKLVRQYGMPVRVRYNTDDELEAFDTVSQVTLQFMGGRNAQIAEHAWSHSLNGGDPLWVETLMIRKPLGVTPVASGSVGVYVQPGFFTYNGTWKYFEGSYLDLTDYQTSGSTTQTFVVITFDPNAAVPHIISGGDEYEPVEYPTYDDLSFDAQDILAVDLAGHWPLAAVRIFSSLNTTRPIDMIADLRDWLSKNATTADGTAYTPAVSGDWTVPPDTIAEALDALAAGGGGGGGSNDVLTWLGW